MEILLWILIFDCGKKTHQQLLSEWAHCMMGQGQVTGVALAQRHSLLKVGCDKSWQMQMAGRKTNRRKVQSPTWQQSEWFGLQASPVWKYFGFWSVDGKNAEPWDKVVCKLCKLQLAYHSTISNMSAHLEKCAPKCAATSRLVFFTASHKLFVWSMTRGVHEETCVVHMQGHEADQYRWWHGLQRVLSRIGTSPMEDLTSIEG